MADNIADKIRRSVAARRGRIGRHEAAPVDQRQCPLRAETAHVDETLPGAVDRLLGYDRTAVRRPEQGIALKRPCDVDLAALFDRPGLVDGRLLERIAARTHPARPSHANSLVPPPPHPPPPQP